MQFDYEISLDIFKRNYVEIESRQYDDMSRRIKILVTKEGEPIAIPSGTELRCEVKKPDGTFVKKNCSQVTESGKTYIVMTLTFNMLAAHGTEWIDIIMQHNNQILGTMSFINRIRKAAVQDDDVMSTSEAQELVEAMEEAETLRTETRAAAEQAAESARSSGNSATEAGNQAVLARSYARGDTSTRDGENLDNAKHYKDLAEQAAGTAARDAREAAREVTQDIIDQARTSADSAQSSANSAAISKDAAEAIAQDLAAQSGVSGTIRINGVLYATYNYVENGIPYTRLSEVASA